MTISWTIDGLALAFAAGAALIATLLMLVRMRLSGELALAVSFAAALTAVAWRWVGSDAPPLRGLGDVFAVMGTLAWPVGIFCRRRAGMPVGVMDALWAFVLLFPAAFIFAGRSGDMPPILRSPLFAPHVMTCLLAYMLVFKAAIAATPLMLRLQNDQSAAVLNRNEAVSRQNVALLNRNEFVLNQNVALLKMFALAVPGLVCLSIGLVLGSIWGSLAWGDWWNWDPKELLTLSAWLALLAGHAFGTKRPRKACASVLVSALLMLITLTWANLSTIFAGLHTYPTN